MKHSRIVSVLVIVAEALALGGSSSASNASVVGGRFGPQNCVLIERSSQGSCIIRTECYGQDTSSLEFAFDCWSADGDIFKHSFGQGGFGENEEFDTEVKCAQCHPPSAPTPAPKSAEQAVQLPKQVANLASVKAVQHPLLPKAGHKNFDLRPSARVAAAIAGTEGEHKGVKALEPPRNSGALGDLADRPVATPAPTVSRYGPKDCVSTWRSSEGHCIVKTMCQDVDISSYEFGLVCVDSKGMKTRHTFGRGSFDNVETFDTLAECSECLGLDDQRVVALRVQRRRWKQSAEANEVATLSAEVKTLTQGMTTMLASVMKLRQQVKERERQKTTPPPSVVATLKAWSGEDVVEAAATKKEEVHEAIASKPRLRIVPTQEHSTAQAKRKHHHHHHRHRKRRVVEDEDRDSHEEKDKHRGNQEKKHKASEKAKKEWTDEQIVGATNGVGEPLGEATPYSAEASELSVATDGEAIAGGLDDSSAMW